MHGNLISNIMFQKYIFVLGLGIIIGGMIYFMDYKKIGKYSLLIYLVGVFLNIISYISADARLEYLYASLPFYVISFAGFISTINQKKRNILKTIILAIISILLLRIMVWASETARFVATTYLIMSTIKILKLKKNRIKYLAIIWIVPIIFTSFYVYEAKIHYSELDYSNGEVNGRKELFHTAELFGTVKDPRRNSNDTTAYDFINSEYTFLAFLADYGWVVSIAMSLCVISLYIKLIINAIKIKDEYGKFIIISITTIYILQTVENFRKAFHPWGVISESRIPLVTFGITDLFVNILCMALVLSIYRGKNINFECQEMN